MQGSDVPLVRGKDRRSMSGGGKIRIQQKNNNLNEHAGSSPLGTEG